METIDAGSICCSGERWIEVTKELGALRDYERNEPGRAIPGRTPFPEGCNVAGQRFAGSEVGAHVAVNRGITDAMSRCGTLQRNGW